MALYARHVGNQLLESRAQGIPVFEQPLRFGYTTPTTRVAALDTLASMNHRAVYLHLINRDFDKSIALEVELGEFRNLTGRGTIYTLAGRLNKRPGPGETRQVAHVEQSTVRLEGTALQLDLPARTVTCVELPRRP